MSRRNRISWTTKNLRKISTFRMKNPRLRSWPAEWRASLSRDAAANRRERRGRLVSDLVERFDIESYSDFSAKWPNFTRLVLFCIDAKFCRKIFVGKLLTRSTGSTCCFCTAQTSIFQQNFVKRFRIFRQIFANFDHSHRISLRFWWKFLGISPSIYRKCWTAKKKMLNIPEIFWISD